MTMTQKPKRTMKSFLKNKKEIMSVRRKRFAKIKKSVSRSSNEKPQGDKKMKKRSKGILSARLTKSGVRKKGKPNAIAKKLIKNAENPKNSQSPRKLIVKKSLFRRINLQYRAFSKFFQKNQKSNLFKSFPKSPTMKPIFVHLASVHIRLSI
jgi:hypothetical protein